MLEDILRQGKTDGERVLAYLKEELPGFENQLRISDDHMLRLEVRTMFRFGAVGEMDLMVFPVPNEQFVAGWADQLIQKTRQDAINKLGLDKEIVRQVESRVREEVATAVASQKAQWRQDGWQDGFKSGTEFGVELRQKISDAVEDDDDADAAFD